MAMTVREFMTQNPKTIRRDATIGEARQRMLDFNIRHLVVTSQGDRAIIALRSTARGGEDSRIVATLRPGAGVVTTRAHVQTVVTEHGIAELHGRSIAERARALIAIAHPKFRHELLAFGRRTHYV